MRCSREEYEVGAEDRHFWCELARLYAAIIRGEVSELEVEQMLSAQRRSGRSQEPLSEEVTTTWRDRYGPIAWQGGPAG